MFREASVYLLKKQCSSEALQSYGLRVLVMRRWPRGISRSDIDLWLPTAGPSLELLSALRRASISWEEFAARYCCEQTSQLACRLVSYEHGMPCSHWYATGSLDYLGLLERQHGLVSLLCHEQGPLCHRYLLKYLLESSSRASRKE